jgi:hypothetical protein
MGKIWADVVLNRVVKGGLVKKGIRNKKKTPNCLHEISGLRENGKIPLNIRTKICREKLGALIVTSEHGRYKKQTQIQGGRRIFSTNSIHTKCWILLVIKVL